VVKLKAITDIICNIVSSKAKLNYGAIPYRTNQSMKISGDNSKYNATFGELRLTDINDAIAQTISFYREQLIISDSGQ
jgi:hypothetical protein